MSAIFTVSIQTTMTVGMIEWQYSDFQALFATFFCLHVPPNASILHICCNLPFFFCAILSSTRFASPPHVVYRVCKNSIDLVITKSVFDWVPLSKSNDMRPWTLKKNPRSDYCNFFLVFLSPATKERERKNRLQLKISSFFRLFTLSFLNLSPTPHIAKIWLQQPNFQRSFVE